MRVVKFPKTEISHNRSFHLENFRLASYESKHKNLKEGKLTLSLKYGKRRKLVTGTLYITEEYSRHWVGSWDEYFFVPNNLEKMLEVMAKE